MDGWMDGRITVIIVCNLLEFRSNFFFYFYDFCDCVWHWWVCTVDI